MEDKNFVLLTRMYNEFSAKFSNIDVRLDRVEGHITRLENEHGKKLDALFDGYKKAFEKLQEHDNRFDVIENKLDNLSFKISGHDSKLEVLDGGRKK